MLVKDMTIDELCTEVNRRLDEDELKIWDSRVTVAVTPRNVRYYQTLGLLPAPSRTDGRADYSSEHVDAIVQIKHAQADGTALNELPQRRDVQDPALNKFATTDDNITTQFRDEFKTTFRSLQTSQVAYSLLRTEQPNLRTHLLNNEMPWTLDNPDAVSSQISHSESSSQLVDTDASPPASSSQATREDGWSMKVGSIVVSGIGDRPDSEYLSSLAELLQTFQDERKER